MILETRKAECLPGTYSQAGSTQCSACIPGYRCPMGSTTPAPPDYECEKGGWCDGLYYYPCPSGTFNDQVGSIDDTACTACEPGKCTCTIKVNSKTS